MMTRWRLVSVALFASLAINLFLGGLMMGRWLDPRHHGGPAHAERDRPPAGSAPGWLLRAVGPEGAPALDKAWRTKSGDIEPLRVATDRARAAVVEALESTPYDPVAYAAALAGYRDAMHRMRTAVDGLMVDIVGQLTAEQRHRLVERGREWERRRAERK